MNLHKLLKGLMVGEIGLALTGVLVGRLLKHRLPAELLNYQNRIIEEDPTVFEWVLLAVTIPLMIFYVWTIYSLWTLKPRGRMFYTIALISTIPSYPLYPVVASGAEYAFYAASAMASGVILGLIYFSDLRFHFETGKKDIK